MNRLKRPPKPLVKAGPTGKVPAVPGTYWIERLGCLKVAEGCDRACGFCAIPSFRGKQRSRTPASILAEAEALNVKEVVLVAQDLASYGRDRGRPGAIVPLIREVAARVERVRLLYL